MFAYEVISIVGPHQRFAQVLQKLDHVESLKGAVVLDASAVRGVGDQNGPFVHLAVLSFAFAAWLPTVDCCEGYFLVHVAGSYLELLPGCLALGVPRRVKHDECDVRRARLFDGLSYLTFVPVSDYGICGEEGVRRRALAHFRGASEKSS